MTDTYKLLKGMGYDIVVSKTSSCEELLNAIPHLRSNPMELRQWTVRLRSDGASADGAGANVWEVTPPQADFVSAGSGPFVELSVTDGAFSYDDSSISDCTMGLSWAQSKMCDTDVFEFDMNGISFDY